MADDWDITNRDVIAHVIAALIIGALITIAILKNLISNSATAIAICVIIGFIFFELVYYSIRKRNSESEQAS